MREVGRRCLVGHTLHAHKLMEAHKSIKAANLSVSFRSSTKFPQIPADSVESCSVEEALSLTSTGLALTSTGLEVSLVCPGTAAYVETRPYGAFQAADWPRLPEARGSLEHDQALRPPVSQLAEV